LTLELLDRVFPPNPSAFMSSAEQTVHESVKATETMGASTTARKRKLSSSRRRRVASGASEADSGTVMLALLSSRVARIKCHDQLRSI